MNKVAKTYTVDPGVVEGIKKLVAKSGGSASSHINAAAKRYLASKKIPTK